MGDDPDALGVPTAESLIAKCARELITSIGSLRLRRISSPRLASTTPRKATDEYPSISAVGTC